MSNPEIKIVYTGTRQVYGRIRCLPVDESHPLNPVDINGINKLAGEYYHILYNNLYKIKTTSLRLTNTYGPRQLIKHSRQGFVGWFGPYDLDAHVREGTGDTSVRALLRCGTDACTPAALAEASPVGFVDDKDPPVLLIHGKEDRQVLPAQSKVFAERLRTAGVPVDLLLIADVGHGFIGVTPAATRDASRQALSATFDFFDRLFAAPDAQRRVER